VRPEVSEACQPDGRRMIGPAYLRSVSRCASWSRSSRQGLSAMSAPILLPSKGRRHRCG